MQLFFDLDVTLLDFSERLYRLYYDGVAPRGYAVLSKVEYMELKRDGVSEPEILAKTGAAALEADYLPWRHGLLESREYFRYDTLLPGVTRTLDLLSTAHDLAVVTLRSNRDLLREQLA